MKKQGQIQDMSQYAGSRFDLVQAGGGNSSVKLDDETMIVKASGINLSEVSSSSGYVDIRYQDIRDWFKNIDLSAKNKAQREQLGKEVLSLSANQQQGKPSIETFLHALLNTYTLHTHPVSVNAITALDNWKELLLEDFPDSICVPYATPGIDLALRLVEALENCEVIPQIIFLQNHGLIVSSDKCEDVYKLTDRVSSQLSKKIGLDLTRYENVTELQQLVKNQWDELPVIYCSDDKVIKDNLANESATVELWPFCPDTLIYCGVRPVYLSSINDVQSVDKYHQEYSEAAKVLVLNDQVYFVNISLKKAAESEALFKFHLLAVANNGRRINRLSIEEISYLNNWDAEKYRQEV